MPAAGPIVVDKVVAHRIGVRRHLGCRLNWDKGIRSRIVAAVEAVENRILKLIEVDID